MRNIDAFLVLILKFVCCILLTSFIWCLLSQYNFFSLKSLQLSPSTSWTLVKHGKNNGGLLTLSLLSKLEISPIELHKNGQKYLTEMSNYFYTLKQGKTNLIQHQAIFRAWQYQLSFLISPLWTLKNLIIQTKIF